MFGYVYVNVTADKYLQVIVFFGLFHELSDQNEEVFGCFILLPM